MDELKTSLPRRRDESRGQLRQAKVTHDRTPDNIASLALGLETFLKFAKDVGAIDEKEKEKLWLEGWTALQQLADRQQEQHVDSNPAEMFMRLLRAAIASGKCHLVDKKGLYADNPSGWGWRDVSGDRRDWRSQGDCIGWVDGDDVYLEPTAA
jgi:hypothetical protein